MSARPLASVIFSLVYVENIYKSLFACSLQWAMSIFKGQKFCMGRFIDFANQVMEQLVSSLSDKSIDFIQKLENSEAIRTQDGYTFPGKLQFILDWLLGSLLKIGKFDDSNLYNDFTSLISVLI